MHDELTAGAVRNVSPVIPTATPWLSQDQKLKQSGIRNNRKFHGGLVDKGPAYDL